MGKTNTRCWALDWGIAVVSLPLFKKIIRGTKREKMEIKC